MGSSHSATAERQRFLWGYWVALSDAHGKPKGRADKPFGEGPTLTDMPHEMLARIFGVLPPLDALVALARCGRTCRTLATFARDEIPHVRMRPPHAWHRNDSHTRLRGFHCCLDGTACSSLDGSEIKTLGRSVNVLMPILFGACAVPVTLTSVDPDGFTDETLSTAVAEWYAARVTPDDMAFVHASGIDVYYGVGVSRLYATVKAMADCGFGPERLSACNLCPADTLGAPCATNAPPGGLRRRFPTFRRIEHDTIDVCMHGRRHAWIYADGQPKVPRCPLSASCLRTEAVVFAVTMTAPDLVSYGGPAKDGDEHVGDPFDVGFLRCPGRRGRCKRVLLPPAFIKP